MSFSTKANRWSPKLIIGFQLTIWSIVGIVLLQKGAISLYGTKEAERNDTTDTQERLTRWNEKKSIRDSSIAEKRHRIVEHEIATRQKDVILSNLDVAAQNGQWPSKQVDSYRMDNTGVTKKSPMISKLTTNRKQDTRDIRAIQAQTFHQTNKNEEGKVDRKEKHIVALNLDENPYDMEKIATSNNGSSNSLKFDDTGSNFLTLDEKKFFEHQSIPYEAAGIGKNQTQSARSPVNRVGAAVAIIMLAIGIVMLLLGPLIVILRAFADRRRTRQMLLKSRCRIDQPPTYEEATLMDQAPRYSSLQLDSIPESSSSL
ncbi:uncharacterized protein LOC128875304 [Hylaeus volcanicus]|uniref:uncharacterized protein LOC128875304 n=1 Tax=Hylaeus volcanicus TaxID=313075 RepID=UPI0023B801DA|nr:uncharacterized protein LOC128875304 [Hylaeus volcanicus]XP_053976752.1 uncharacterized protein LOC128875304 [Hylaeus volcanicus]